MRKGGKDMSLPPLAYLFKVKLKGSYLTGASGATCPTSHRMSDLSPTPAPTPVAAVSSDLPEGKEVEICVEVMPSKGVETPLPGGAGGC